MTELTSEIGSQRQAYLRPDEDLHYAFYRYAQAVGNLNMLAEMPQTEVVVREIKVYAEPDAFTAFRVVRQIVRELRELGHQEIF